MYLVEVKTIYHKSEHPIIIYFIEYEGGEGFVSGADEFNSVKDVIHGYSPTMFGPGHLKPLSSKEVKIKVKEWGINLPNRYKNEYKRERAEFEKSREQYRIKPGQQRYFFKTEAFWGKVTIFCIICKPIELLKLQKIGRMEEH